MFHFMSLSAPYVIGPENTNLYWFDPETMDPLVESEGHRRATFTHCQDLSAAAEGDLARLCVVSAGILVGKVFLMPEDAQSVHGVVGDWLNSDVRPG